jgi:hypothetical protein
VKHKEWVRNPIDSFILARLEKEGLAPAPEADRRTIARRLALDLTGLPPEPAVVDAFVADPHPDAYDRLVDTLLSSLEWGEHRGRHWLDYARYADTHGIHFDNYREMWTYRQWVINAFNRNMPFDQFTILQLAGDLVSHHGPNATPEQILDNRIASGFNRCNMTTNEGGTIAEEYLVLYTRDRTETTSAVWLGLTTGCAVCHDHKFDPLSQQEFYELSAFFNNTTQAAMDGNIHDTPPILPVPRVEDRPRFAVLEREIPVDEGRRRGAQENGASRSSRPGLRGLTPEACQANRAARHAFLSKCRFPKERGRGHEDRNSAARRSTCRFCSGTIRPGRKAPNGTIGGLARRQVIGRAAQRRRLRARSGLFRRVPNCGFGNDELPTARSWPAGRPDRIARLGPSGCRSAANRDRIAHEGTDDARSSVVADKPLKPDQWTLVAVTYDGSGKAEGVKHLLRRQADAKAKRSKTTSSRRGQSASRRRSRSAGDREAISPPMASASRACRIWGRGLTAG